MSRLMLLESLLKDGVAVAARSAEILLSIFEIVLVQLRLRLYKRQLVGGGIAIGSLFRQLGDAVLVGGQLRLQLGNALIELAERTAGRKRHGSRLAESGGIGLVELVISQAQGLARESLLFGGIGLRS